MPTLSIIIPTYNSSQYIEQAIDSVIAQTYQDWELIIVDDCSTDNTQSILKDYAKRDSRIRILSTTSQSGSAAIPARLGVEKSLGEYVSRIDADDYISADYYSIMMPLALQNKKSVITSTAFRFESKGKTINHVPSFPIGSTPDKISSHDAFILSLFHNIFGNATITSKEFYLHNTTHDNIDVCINTDENDFRQMLLSAESVLITNAKYYYRIHDNSITHRISPSFFERLCTNIDMYELSKLHIGESRPDIILKLQHDGWRYFLSYRLIYLQFQKKLTQHDCKRIRQTFYKAWKMSKKKRFFPITNSIKQRIITNTYICFQLYSFLKYHLEKKRY